MKKYCTFPDQTKFQVHSILDKDESHTYICYYYENIQQILWVPNDFLSND
jgi:hypothetical protein